MSLLLKKIIAYASFFNVFGFAIIKIFVLEPKDTITYRLLSESTSLIKNSGSLTHNMKNKDKMQNMQGFFQIDANKLLKEGIFRKSVLKNVSMIEKSQAVFWKQIIFNHFSLN